MQAAQSRTPSNFETPTSNFVATVAVARENGIAGNVFPYTYRDEETRTLTGSPPTAERQKSYLLRNGSYGATAGGNGKDRAATECLKLGIRLISSPFAAEHQYHQHTAGC